MNDLTPEQKCRKDWWESQEPLLRENTCPMEQEREAAVRCSSVRCEQMSPVCEVFLGEVWADVCCH